MAQGKFGAYKALRPTNNNISDLLIQDENLRYKQRAEERLIEDRKAKAKEKKDLKAQQARDRMKTLGLFDTGSDTLNGTIADTIRAGQETMMEQYDILNNPKSTNKEKTKASLMISSLEKLPENLKIFTNKITREYSEYLKGVENGTLHRLPEYEERFSQGYKGFSIGIDDDGMPVSLVKRTGVNDVNKDGKIDEFDVETFDSLNDVYQRPNFMKKYNYLNAVKGHIKRLDGLKYKDDAEFESALNESVNNLLLKDGRPTDVLRSFAASEGLSLDNMNDLKNIRDKYYTDVYNGTSRGKKIDNTLKERALKLKEDALNFKKNKYWTDRKDKKDEKLKTSNTVTISKQEDGRLTNGNDLKFPEKYDKDGNPITYSENSKVILLPNTVTTKNGNKYDKLIIDNGEITVVGSSKQTPVLNEDGEEWTSKDDEKRAKNKKWEKYNGTEFENTIRLTDESVVDEVIKSIRNGKGKSNIKGDSQGKFGSQKELIDYINSISKGTESQNVKEEITW